MLEDSNSSPALAWGSAEVRAGRAISGLEGPPFHCPDIFSLARGGSGLQTQRVFEGNSVAITDRPA